MADAGLAAGTELTQVLLAAARRLAESLDAERVYDSFHELLDEVIPHDGVVVSSFDPDDGLIRCEYAWVEGSRIDASTLPPLPLNRDGGGMQSRAIVTGEPLLVNDVAEHVQQPGGTYYNVDREGRVEKIPDAGPARTSAAMMVPIKHGSAVVGVVQLMRDRGRYEPRDLELFSALVGLLHAAVRNARLQAERAQLQAIAAAERARADEREQAVRVLELVGDGIILVDRDGVIAFSNRAADAVSGRELRGLRVADVFGGWNSVAEAVPIARDVAATRSMTLPVSVNGHEFWLSFVAVESAEGIVYAFRDLTGERQLDEEKRDFVATVSHELRTPMTGVYGAAQTLLRSDIDLEAAQRRELLELIVGQAERLTQIVDDLLLATSLDHHRLRLSQELVDVELLLRRTLDTLPQPDVEITVRDQTFVLGDRDRIQQILVNLLDNAFKYGRPPVTVSVEPAGDAVAVTVCDSGGGIPREEQARLFEKFYRSDPKLTRAPSGTGLGLYIARELAVRMGGTLDVRSADETGTAFVLTLPRPNSNDAGRDVGARANPL
ncbi:MAG TPA: ATP-binding protein [Gaiellaceae bacterium]|nr:ATP-binding protein [Gaiellaceae bacterium]